MTAIKSNQIKSNNIYYRINAHVYIKHTHKNNDIYVNYIFVVKYAEIKHAFAKTLILKSKIVKSVSIQQ